MIMLILCLLDMTSEEVIAWKRGLPQGEWKYECPTEYDERLKQDWETKDGSYLVGHPGKILGLRVTFYTESETLHLKTKDFSDYHQETLTAVARCSQPRTWIIGKTRVKASVLGLEHHYPHRAKMPGEPWRDVVPDKAIVKLRLQKGEVKIPIQEFREEDRTMIALYGNFLQTLLTEKRR